MDEIQGLGDAWTLIFIRIGFSQLECTSIDIEYGVIYYLLNTHSLFSPLQEIKKISPGPPGGLRFKFLRLKVHQLRKTSDVLGTLTLKSFIPPIKKMIK